MFNVTVINAKKSLMRIALLTVTLVTLFFATKMVTKFKTNEILQINISENLIKCLNSEIPAIESTYYKANNMIKVDGEEDDKETLVGKILGIELVKIQEIKQETVNTNVEEVQLVENDIQENQGEQQAETIKVSTNVSTEIVTKNPITESYNVEINGVKIKNETSFELNNSILETQTNINKENILIKTRF